MAAALLKDFIAEGVSRLGTLYRDREAASLVNILCEEILGVRRYTHVTDPHFEIPEEILPGLEDCLRRLCDGEPLQYILGRQIFCDRTFKVTPAVLIPRQETEMLVGEALEWLADKTDARVLDLCTGSGCIAWSIALSRPGTAVTAIDISEEALEVARSQEFEDLHAEGVIPPRFLQADIFGKWRPDEDGPFDLIIANPPYVMVSQRAQMQRNVLEYEPHVALFAPEDDPLAFYRAIAAWASTCLKDGGLGLVEINDALGLETAAVFRDGNYKKCSVLKDVFDRCRAVRFTK